MLTQEMVDELGDAAAIEGSELGEYWTMLIDMHESYSDMISDELLAAVATEILNQYNYFKETFQVVEEEITTVRVVKRLNEI